MSLTLEELRGILAGPAGLDTTKNVLGIPEKLGELLAQINGVSDEQILADLGPAIIDDKGKAVHEPGESADPDDVVVPAKGTPLIPDKYRPPKTARDIVNESKTPQLNLATVIDAYIRLVVDEMTGGGSGDDDPLGLVE